MSVHNRSSGSTGPEQLEQLRGRLQAISALGDHALRTTALDSLLDTAATTLADTLQMTHTSIVTYNEDPEALTLAAGVGWDTGLHGYAWVDGGWNSPFGYALITGEPVIIKDLTSEKRFTSADLLRRHSIRSGVCVRIGLENAPVGVVGIYSQDPGQFSEDDVQFLQAVADLLSAAADRLIAHDELNELKLRYETLTALTTDYVFVLRIDGEHSVAEWVSGELMDKMGYSLEDLNTQGWGAVLDPKDRERARTNLASAANSQRVATIRAYTRSGEPRTLRIHLRYSPDRSRIYGAVQDITEQHAAEQQLQYQAHLLDSVGDAIFSADADLKVKYWNRGAEEIYGWTAEEAVGRSVPELIPVADPALDLEGTRRQLREQGYWRGEWVQRTRDGSVVHVENHTQVLYNEDGSIDQFVVVNRDITQRKRVEKSLYDSELRFQQIADQMQEVIWISDADKTRTLYVNPAYERIWGRPQQTLYDDINDFFKWVHPDDRARIAEAQREQREGRYKQLFRVVRPDGEVRWVRSQVFPIYNAEGEIVQLAGLVVDNTDIMTAREALADSEQRFRLALTDSPLTVWYKDLDFRYRWIFNSVLVDNGIEVIGKTERDLLEDPHEAAYLEGLYRLAVERKEIMQHEVTLTWEGEPHYFDLRLAPILDANGEVQELMGVTMDVTQARQQERDIRQMNDILEQRVAERTAQYETLNRELEAFSYSVSHDLRAPLRAIDGFSQALEEDYADQLGEDGLHFLRRIRVGAQRMAQLINDLLMLSRVTRTEIHREPLDLAQMAHEIVQECSEMEPDRQFTLHCPTSIPAYADASLIRVALGNLINNAWKFAKDQPHTHITVGMEHKGDSRVYYVRDNGMGFDMQYADKLFLPFQRLHTPGEMEGTGIGLATVQRIVHCHEGEVWGEGAVGEGASIYFTLEALGTQADD